MPFRPDKPVAGALALNAGFDLNPEEEVVDGNLLGAAFRSENPIVSAATSFEYNQDAPYDPSYRAWDDIQGTVYEQYSDRFVEARNADEAGQMKAQIDREIEDRKTMDAAGAWGFVAGMGAAVLSPTSLLPGGAIVRGAGGGVSLARTAASAGAWAGAAAAIDEIALQGSQATRTAEESAYAIGGSVILGGLLGGSVGLLSREAHMRSSTTAAELPIAQQELGDQLRSIGAAENAQDFTLRRENLFGWINRTPVLRGIVRSDPILRGQLSDNREARRATAELVETPLQYGVNEQGQTVGTSAETVIKARRNTELAGALGYLDRSFTEYWHDGPVGLIGRATAPISARWQNLLGRTEKLNRDEFMNEVGRAAILGDQHPIPQVQKAAEDIRKNIFDRAKLEATEVGIFDEDLQLKNGESYFMRSYNIEKIIQHMGDGSADDIKLLLRDAYMENRAAAQNRLKLDKATRAVEGDQKALKMALEQKSRDEFYAERTDLEIEADIDDTINSIIGLKPGEHSFRASLSSPTRARVLDIATAKLEPWLETDMGVVMSQYFSSIVPDIEITRKFGDMNLSVTKQRIIDEKDRMIRSATSAKERTRITREAEDRLRELDAMRDRIRGTYGAPDNPRSVWVRGARTLRTLSYTGYLGGMTVSALPDVANMVGRNGLEAAFGSLEALTNPRRMGLAIKDAKELGAAAEWYLNSRAASIADIADQYGEYTRFERMVGATGRAFGVATGMVPWNVAWKSVGGALSASKMSKAAVAVKAGTASKDQLLKLAENGIDTVMAQRIADQIERFADRNGNLWLPQAAKWTDPEAFAAMRNAMNREMDLMVITPGQDVPLSFSTETGKFFSQFKSFVVSSHHRVFLSGIQRADAAVLAQVLTAVALGMMVSRIKSYVGGYDQKEGAALWEDAIDRSGLTGWLMEAHGLANGFTGGQLSISGQETSRFQSRSEFEGLLGPSVDMVAGMYEGVSAMGRGEMTSRDARKLLRPLPGNNLPYLMGLTKEVADSVSDIGQR